MRKKRHRSKPMTPCYIGRRDRVTSRKTPFHSPIVTLLVPPNAWPVAGGAGSSEGAADCGAFGATVPAAGAGAAPDTDPTGLRSKGTGLESSAFMRSPDTLPSAANFPTQL